jgi:hypothetical protein
MDYGKLIDNAFTYTKDGLLGNIATWILLIVLAVIPAVPVLLFVFAMVFTVGGGVPDFTLMFAGLGIGIILAVILSAFLAGYQIRILRGTTPLPPVDNFGKLFADGIRYIIIQFVYMIPVIVVIALVAGAAIIAAATGSNTDALVPLIGSLLLGILIALVLAFVIGLFAVIGVVRFSRTGSVKEAFNFTGILATIRKIGWGSYILAFIILVVVIMVIQIVAGIIPIIGGIIQLIISPWITVFASRYICLLYDSAGPA